MTLLLAAFFPMLKLAGYLVPLAGMGYGDAAAAYDEDRFNNCLVSDMGTARFMWGDDLILDYAT